MHRRLAIMERLQENVTQREPRHRQRSRDRLLSWWNSQVASVDLQAVVWRVREDAGLSSHYVFMTLMSAGIAILGLILSSPAVVIGAMLISPLMGPIVGLGFALAVFDADEIRRALLALIVGVALAVAFCAAIVLASPLQTITSEIASRTRPNLFDLLVALFSGLAGTYAMIRGRQGTIVGVAIATALMPPLAVIGFGLATANWTVLAGSSMLFFTNLMTIAASAALLARLYGFAPTLSPHQSRLQALIIIGSLVALAVPLGMSLRKIAWEAVASRQTRSAIAAQFGEAARIGDLDVDFDADPVEVTATIFTPSYVAHAEGPAEQKLVALFGRPVHLIIDQLRTQSSDVQAVELAKARGGGRDEAAARLAERLSLVAGVPVDEVMIDSPAKQALVRAAPLPGASLAAYRTLEERVEASEKGWHIVIIPPVGDLPGIRSEEGQLLPNANDLLETVAWGSKRTGLQVEVHGPSNLASRVASALIRAGGQATVKGTPERKLWIAWGLHEPAASSADGHRK